MNVVKMDRVRLAMAAAVIDTNIMIQALRGNPITMKWLATVEDKITLPCFVVMELIKGCDTRDELNSLDNFLLLTPHTGRTGKIAKEQLAS